MYLKHIYNKVKKEMNFIYQWFNLIFSWFHGNTYMPHVGILNQKGKENEPFKYFLDYFKSIWNSCKLWIKKFISTWFQNVTQSSNSTWALFMDLSYLVRHWELQTALCI